MTAKEYLSEARTIKYQISAKKRELANLHLDAEVLKGNIIEERVQATPRFCNNDIENIDKLERLIQYDTSAKVTFNLQLHRMLAELENGLYNAILTDYYINGLKLETIAKLIPYEESYTRRLHGRALDMFRDIHGNSFEYPFKTHKKT